MGDPIGATNLPTIIKKHKATIDISKSTMIRNEIVHGGRLLDSEIEELVTQKASIESQRYSVLNLKTESISGEEYKMKIDEFYKEFIPFVQNKRKNLQEHLESTLLVSSDIFKELAKVACSNLNGKRIEHCC